MADTTRDPISGFTPGQAARLRRVNPRTDKRAHRSGSDLRPQSPSSSFTSIPTMQNYGVTSLIGGVTPGNHFSDVFCMNHAGESVPQLLIADVCDRHRLMLRVDLQESSRSTTLVRSLLEPSSTHREVDRDDSAQRSQRDSSHPEDCRFQRRDRASRSNPTF